MKKPIPPTIPLTPKPDLEISVENNEDYNLKTLLESHGLDISKINFADIIISLGEDDYPGQYVVDDFKLIVKNAAPKQDFSKLMEEYECNLQKYKKDLKLFKKFEERQRQKKAEKARAKRIRNAQKLLEKEGLL
jgi:hypothetical protein